MGTKEENIIENLVCFIYGGAGARPLHRLQLRPRPKSTSSERLRPASQDCCMSSQQVPVLVLFIIQKYVQYTMKNEHL